VADERRLPVRHLLERREAAPGDVTGIGGVEQVSGSHHPRQPSPPPDKLMEEPTARTPTAI